MYDNLCKRISKKFGRQLSPTEMKFIVDWKEQYGMLDNIIIEAVDRAIKQKSTDISFAYINAIIIKWHGIGVKTYNDIVKLDEEYYKKKKEQKLQDTETTNTVNKRDTKAKNFVFDTNILIHNPYSLFKFENNNIYITFF